jgi:spoIIIJ-associated protein
VGEQAEVVRKFLVGLVDAFGLEGEVSTRVEGDIIYADVSGDQTEALVGPKGVILDAVMELCRTMVHRHSQAGARLRLDIAGYSERRREALRIYARRLADKVVADGGEIMLEPMNPADRKVVHDAIAEIDGVRSFSEGEDPERSVVIAPDDEDGED